MAESPNFCGALSLLVNHLAAGEAPSFLQRFLAGGVSIALSKGALAVRPLCCGDPFRRLVAKCFCVLGKDDISKVSQLWGRVPRWSGGRGPFPEGYAPARDWGGLGPAED